MAINILSSNLKVSANNILAVNLRPNNSLVRAQNEYKKFGNYITGKQREIEAIQIPDNKKMKEFANINIIDTFGSAGGLLQSLAGGALDLGGLIGGFFPGEGKKIGSLPDVKSSGEKPILRGGKLRLNGVKALGIANSVFAGLDFATGLAEGESVGKSAAGTAGSLAGSLLGGAIGQTLIPIPGVGFVIGSVAGSFIGGYTADRAYDVTSPEARLKVKQEEKLKEQSKAQDLIKRGRVKKQNEIIEKFGGIIDMFEGFVGSIIGGAFSAAASFFGQEGMMDYGLNPDDIPDSPDLEGELQDMIVTGGKLPSESIQTSGYGWRWGRLHSGVDYGEESGTPISVVQPGVITYADELGGYGNLVQISHPGGTSTAYAHLSKINVRKGQQIEPGTLIGYVGSTGRSTGPHLHFEILKGGNPIPIVKSDGDKYFRFGGNVKVKPKPVASIESSQIPSLIVSAPISRMSNYINMARTFTNNSVEPQQTIPTLGNILNNFHVVTPNQPQNIQREFRVAAIPPNPPPNVQQYMEYNLHTSTVIIPGDSNNYLIQGGNESSNPIIIPSGGGSRNLNSVNLTANNHIPNQIFGALTERSLVFKG